MTYEEDLIYFETVSLHPNYQCSTNRNITVNVMDNCKRHFKGLRQCWDDSNHLFLMSCLDSDSAREKYGITLDAEI